MKVAVLGGTGNFGKGISLRLAKKHDILLGSRSKEKAEETASLYEREARENFGEMTGSISGLANEDAVSDSTFVILAVNANALESFLDLSQGFEWKNKLVLSPVTRFEYTRGVFTYKPFEYEGRVLSAAELIKTRLDSAKVVSGMQLVPASKLANPKSSLGYDVPFSGPREGFAEIANVLGCVDGLRLLYAGPLSVSSLIEAALPLMLNIAVRNSLDEPGLKLV